MKVGFSSSFKRAFKKKVLNKGIEPKFWNKLETFVKNPYDSSLRTHKLTGELKDLWGFSVEYDCRVIFRFLEKDKILFVDIGTHDEVY
ncbi:MAG: type II toxin-antitoxin system mRNA interferase toxin, RelE/StbE family [Nitrospirota bacterium]